MKSSEIRKKFLEFFSTNGHTIVQSSPLIPAEDPTLLFTNAGMNQFKDLFLGKETRSYSRATSMQKCVRAGGKHNDLENVGFTPRHLTFFEMMGNFSFGDYFKKEAIQFAWDFLTKEMGLPAEKLHASVYKDDDESYNLWKDMIGLPEERIVRCGQIDNFWSMGDTGPCGPCSEIHFEQDGAPSCGDDCIGVNCDNCSKIVEIWNLVFMQYNRDENGTMHPLKQTGVDTGMGFERLCMVKQDIYTIFETDIFQALIKKIEAISGKSYASSPDDIKAAFHVLADHVRSTSLIIADGGSPSNDGRGYVLRKIIRRAALFGQKLSNDSRLFTDLAQEFINDMSDIFPELKKSESLILKVFKNEIDRFAMSLLQGQGILDKYLAEQKQSGSSTLTGSQVFKLYDTFGFPAELTKVIAEENNFTLDMNGFEKEMAKQKASSGKKTAAKTTELDIPDSVATKFVGYEKLETTSPVLWVSQPTENSIWVVTQESPFYVESGGQVNDQGFVSINEHSYPVIDLKKVGDKFGRHAIAVKLKTSGTVSINTGDTAHCTVNNQTRLDTVRNHTATHMLQSALISVLGPVVKQAGSVVKPDYLTFDYTYPEPISAAQIKQVEDLLNAKIQENIKTEIMYTTLDNARKQGIIAFFGEKYNPENVRVVTIPGFSAELCGGTHASATGIIGSFKIVSDTALSTGTRRITAVTGPKAIELLQDTFSTTKKLGEMFKVQSHEVVATVEKQVERIQELTREIKQLKKKMLKTNIPAWIEQMEDIHGVPFLYLELEDVSNNEFREIALQLEQQKPGFYFFIGKGAGKVNFLGYVSKAVAGKVDLQKISTELRENFGLRGGGKAPMIQGGGVTIKAGLKQALIKLIQ